MLNLSFDVNMNRNMYEKIIDGVYGILQAMLAEFLCFYADRKIFILWTGWKLALKQKRI